MEDLFETMSRGNPSETRKSRSRSSRAYANKDLERRALKEALGGDFDEDPSFLDLDHALASQSEDVEWGSGESEFGFFERLKLRVPPLSMHTQSP